MLICSECGDQYHDQASFEAHPCQPFACHSCGWLTPPLRHPDTGDIWCADCLADAANGLR